MKNEKASVLSEVTLYNDKAIKTKKQLISTNKQPSYIESLTYSAVDSKLNQFGAISYDLNALDIDLNLRTSSHSPQDQNIAYGSSSGHFQSLDEQYDFDCTYSKGTTEIQAVANMILKSRFIRNPTRHFH